MTARRFCGVVVLLAGVTALVSCEGGAASRHRRAIPEAAAQERARATVYLFVAADCPISNAYAPEMARIEEAYRERGVAFFAVYTDPAMGIESAMKHAAEYGLTFPALLDPGQSQARWLGATVTPEAAVVDAGGELKYLGRIDDLYYDYGRRRAAPVERDLRDAIDAVLDGRPVARPRVPAIGCEISFEE